MTTRLPFTLTPLDGEPFDLWLHAYTASLAMSPGHLAKALGMPGRQDHVTGVTGLTPPTVTAMLARGPSPPRPLMLAWAACGTARSWLVRWLRTFTGSVTRL
jgi:hypothetical protein